MSEQIILDFNVAKARRDDGIQRATEHADRVIVGWQDIAFEAFRLYAQSHERFTTEQVRIASPDVPVPPDKRAWGGVARRAMRDGVVRSIGVVKAQSPTVHCMHVSLYESLVCRRTAL